MEILKLSETSIHLLFMMFLIELFKIIQLTLMKWISDELTSIKQTEEINSSSVGFLIFSESDKFYSDTIN